MTTTQKFFTTIILAAIIACGGGGGGETGGGNNQCPSGQHRDANGVCVPDVIPDTTAPTASLIDPDGTTTLSGTVTLRATASDTGGSGLEGVQFELDGVPVCSALTAAPFEFALDTTTVTTGVHSLTVYAFDRNGNDFRTTAINVVVDNTPPPDVCATWRSDLDGRGIKDFPTNIGLATGHFVLYAENDVCMAKIMGDTVVFGLFTWSPVTEVQYTSPPVSGASVTMPDAVNGGFKTFKFQ